MTLLGSPRARPERFAFGKNWQSFVDHAVTDQRIEVAVESLRRFLQAQSLDGRIFLDVGCGSGLFSLAACRLHAKHVVAFDYDAASVRAAQILRERADVPESRWQLLQGSVLDERFIAGLPDADVVYSWGVLHHTGSMWQALDHVIGKVRPGGLLAIALYNKKRGCAAWWHGKRVYVRAPKWMQRALVATYGTGLMLREALRGRNPVALVRDYGTRVGRGMDFWHDMRDWMGGYPYEYATPAEVIAYVKGRHGLEPIYQNTTPGYGCNEFTFQRPR